MLAYLHACAAEQLEVACLRRSRPSDLAAPSVAQQPPADIPVGQQASGRVLLAARPSVRRLQALASLHTHRHAAQTGTDTASVLPVLVQGASGPERTLVPSQVPLSAALALNIPLLVVALQVGHHGMRDHPLSNHQHSCQDEAAAVADDALPFYGLLGPAQDKHIVLEHARARTPQRYTYGHACDTSLQLALHPNR